MSWSPYLPFVPVISNKKFDAKVKHNDSQVEIFSNDQDQCQALATVSSYLRSSSKVSLNVRGTLLLP